MKKNLNIKNIKKILSLKMPAGFNHPIHAAVIVLNLFGVLMVISGSMTSNATTRGLLFTGVKELAFVIVSYCFMVWTARNFNFKLFKKYSRIILMGVFGLLLIAAISPARNGARAWLPLGPFTIQPSEFAKVFVIAYLALKLGDKNQTRVVKWYDLLKTPVAVVIGIVGIVVVLQKDLGSGAVILGISYISMLVPEHRELFKIQRIMIVLMGIVVLLVFFLDTPAGLSFLSSVFEKFGLQTYMLKRFQSAANPLADRYYTSYQLFIGLVAMIQGFQAGPFGKGYANSINKKGYLPEADTDFILAIVVEELGIIGISIIVVGYGTMLYQFFKYTMLVKLESQKMVLIGVATYILMHFLFNVGGVTGLIPLTGVPLLLISAGGSGRLALLIAIGLAQSVISRHNIERKVVAEKKRKALQT